MPFGLTIFNGNNNSKKEVLEKELLPYIRDMTKSDRKEEEDAFIYNIIQLYRLDYFKYFINTVISLGLRNQAIFKVTSRQYWETYDGLCQTDLRETNEFDSDFTGNLYQISIKSCDIPVIIHEVAHAIEHESKINLNNEFREVFSKDLNSYENKYNNILKNDIKRLFKDSIKGYAANQIMSEMFARFFELMAMSFEFGGNSFYIKDIFEFFPNTIRYIDNDIIPLLKRKINPAVQKASDDFAKSLGGFKKTFSGYGSKKIASKHANGFNAGKTFAEMSSSIFLSEDEEKKIFGDSLKEDNSNRAVLKNGIEYFSFKKDDQNLINNKPKMEAISYDKKEESNSKDLKEIHNLFLKKTKKD